MKSTTPLQRGRACLSCRKRKMKCDGMRPACTQCIKANRDRECHYYEKQHISRTQLLQQKVAKLEARLRELESEHLGSSPSVPSSSRRPGSGGQGDCSESPRSGVTASSHAEWDLCLFPAPGLLSSSSPPLSTSHDSWFDNTPHISLRSGGRSSQHRYDMASAELSLEWWEDANTFCENKRKLLELFLSHRHQCAFDIDVGRLQASLQDPSTSPPPHPALVNAIYLLACYFSKTSHLTQLEAHFLKCALRCISEALHQQDRVVHILQASCLLAVYFYSQGRVLEGYYHSSTAARLAVDSGLHQLLPVDIEVMLQSFSGNSESPGAGAVAGALFSLPYPSDDIEQAERVAAFWQIFIVDRAWSVATGLPSAIPDDDDDPKIQIKNSWPLGISDLTTNYDNPLGSPSAASVITLRAKAVMLYERTARFSNYLSSSDTNWTQRRSLEMSLAEFAANLPGISRYATDSSPSHADIELINVHTLIYAATIHLYRDCLETQQVSYVKCLMSADSVAAIVRELGDGEYNLLDPIISACWRCVADIYLRILKAGLLGSLECDLAAVKSQLNVLVGAFRRLAPIFPVAGLHVSSIEKALATVYNNWSTSRLVAVST